VSLINVRGAMLIEEGLHSGSQLMHLSLGSGYWGGIGIWSGFLQAFTALYLPDVPERVMDASTRNAFIERLIEKKLRFIILVTTTTSRRHSVDAQCRCNIYFVKSFLPRVGDTYRSGSRTRVYKEIHIASYLDDLNPARRDGSGGTLDSGIKRLIQLAVAEGGIQAAVSSEIDREDSGKLLYDAHAVQEWLRNNTTVICFMNNNHFEATSFRA
jgi:hypothetical protein